MRDRYEPNEFEQAWRDQWNDANLFVTQEREGREKFYGLDFFPYPSGAGLSVGHCRNYIPTDVLCRMKNMQGFNVLHPMGFDAFGLPAEVEAIKNKTHPAPMIDKYAATYRRQMELIGVGYDWSRSFKSSDPEYYKWTQWIFKLLFDRGLAYRKDAAVNWCPFDKTVLADEEVVGGLCWRCDRPVEKKNIPQWFFKITDYADRLIDDLDDLDWPEGIKNQQRNWIGRSVGVEFEMKLAPVEGSKAVGQGSSVEPMSEMDKLKAEIAAEGGAGDEQAAAKIDKFKTKMDDAVIDIASTQESVADAEAIVDGTFEVRSRKKTPSFRVFTTRIDTIFGMTFCVLAPEHLLVKEIMGMTDANSSLALHEYREKAKGLSDTDRQATTREKTGVYTGIDAINPANGKRVPVWIADYVMMGYGTGAIMAVPAHDDRDFEFAKKFGIDIIPVIAPADAAGVIAKEVAYDEFESACGATLPFSTKDGVMVNSGEYSGMSVEEGQKSLADWIEANHIGERKTNYRLRDWLISRQRYWGCPVPIVHDKDGEMHAVNADLLPVELPDVESYQPAEDGSSPLADIADFVNVTDPDGRLGRRETDTMGGFACSSWYFLRFCDPHNPDEPWDQKKADYWMPVDCYVGGAEHAVMHLLYARFWTKVLYDAGLVSVKEPFSRLMNQGQVLGNTPYRKARADETLAVGQDGVLVSYEDAKKMTDTDLTWRWVRMSKSKGNVVTPDEAVAEYGADALRIYELFVAPFEADVQWSNDGMQGGVRFLSRVFKLASNCVDLFDKDWRKRIDIIAPDGVSADIRRSTHKTVAKASHDIESFAFNTYISALMTHLNVVNDLLNADRGPTDAECLAISEMLEYTVLILAPAAPHSADEIWKSLGKEDFTYNASWPKADESLTVEDTITIAVQVMGKLRDTIEMPSDVSKEQMEEAALASEKVKKHTEGKTVRKIIVVPGKLVNIVAN